MDVISGEVYQSDFPSLIDVSSLTYLPSGHCTYNVRTLYVHCTNCSYNVRTLYVQCPLGGNAGVDVISGEAYRSDLGLDLTLDFGHFPFKGQFHHV